MDEPISTGYCSLYIRKGADIPSGTNLPFDQQLGPRKNARPGGDGESIIFEVHGLWRADLLVSLQPKSYVPIRVQLCVATGTERLMQHACVVLPDIDMESFSMQFVLPDDGNTYHCTASVVHDDSTVYVHGGTIRSELSVMQWGQA